MIFSIPLCTVTLSFSHVDLIHSLSVLLSTYCTYLGDTFTHKVVSLQNPSFQIRNRPMVFPRGEQEGQFPLKILWRSLN